MKGFMTLLLLLFPLITHAQSARDSMLALNKGIIASGKTQEYKDLKNRVDFLEKKIQKVEVHNSNNIKKSIGYTSSTIGIATAAIELYEKSLSMQNYLNDLSIRMNTKSNIMQDIESLKESNLDELGARTLQSKINALADVEEKIANLKTRMRISKIGMNRSIFKGGSAIALFIATIFIDDITHWWEKTTSNPHDHCLNYLRGWNKKITYCSLGGLPCTQEQMTPFLYVTADLKSYGISDADKFKALDEWSREDPARYHMFLDQIEYTAYDYTVKEYGADLFMLEEHDFSSYLPSLPMIDNLSHVPLLHSPNR
jgi:tetrahydromethanopterin S-methyltransferase subunit G